MRRWLLVIGVFSFYCVTSHAQSQTSPAQSLDGAAEKGISMTTEGNVSLDFREVDIKSVLRVLSLKSGVNIVVSPEISGVVTIQLNEVPWRQALSVIVQTYGYAYEQKGSIIVVSTVDDLKKRREDALVLSEQEPLVTRTYPLNFAKASEIIETIGKMTSDRGGVNFDERTNTLIATDITTVLDTIDEVVVQLDKTTPQVLIEAKIVETNLNDTENLGVEWVTKVTATGTKRPTVFPFPSGTGNRFMPNAFPGTDTDVTAENTHFTYGTLDYTQFQAILELLKTRTNTNILSNPKIVTLDNQTASINVGTDTPIPAFGANAETGQLQVVGITWRNIGVNFKVTPHVNNAGYITMELEPEVSSQVGTKTFQSNDVPLVGLEKTKTNVMVKDNETLVIAGLIKDKTTDVKKKLPILGDIPIIGFVFQKTNKQIDKTDLLIFITPHIITPEIDQEDLNS